MHYRSKTTANHIQFELAFRYASDLVRAGDIQLSCFLKFRMLVFHPVYEKANCFRDICMLVMSL